MNTYKEIIVVEKYRYHSYLVKNNSIAKETSYNNNKDHINITDVMISLKDIDVYKNTIYNIYKTLASEETIDQTYNSINGDEVEIDLSTLEIVDEININKIYNEVQDDN